MTKHLRFLFVMLLAMIWSAGWAAETKTVVCTLAQKSNACTANVDGVVSWSYVKATSTDSYNRGIQWSAPKNVILTANFTSVVKITEVVVNANTNIKTNENCTIALNVGSTSYGEKDIAKGAANADGNANYSYIGTESSNVMTLKLNSSRSLYINTVTITYEVGDSKRDTKVSFGENSGKTFTFTEGKYSDGTFTTPTATETTGVAGTIAYSSSNATAISVDASTGALTFNGYGKATITAKFTPNNTEKYAESTDSYIVENNQKVDESVILFSADAKSFESITGSYKENVGNIDFIATNGKKYTFDVQRAMKNNDRLQLNSSNVTSPSFPDFTNGYKVTIEYETTKATITLSSGSKSVKGSSKDKTILLDVQDGSAFKINITSNVLYISKIEIVPNKVGITLDENSESNTIEAKNGVNVTLKRTMVANEWNTICLPFDVSKEQAQTAFGEGVKIAQLDDKNSTGNTLKFVNMTDYGMEATVPYLIKPSKENTSNEYVFENVNVVADDINKKYETTEGNLVFKGIYNMMDITKDVVDNVKASYYAAFLGDGNKIYKTNGSGNKTKGFRAYFAIPNGAAASALRVVIDGTATSIKNIDSEVVESNAPVYNLQGQRVNGNNLTPGIYVKAGKKFVVK